MKFRSALVLTLGLVLALPASSRAHCEIPCGIYTDSMRIEMLREHYDTVEKSMQQIDALAGGSDMHQLVRWITNKEEHCGEIQHIVTQYFMTQRIKPAGAADAGYAQKLTVLHDMLVTAMKCKQSTDRANVTRLRELTDQFVELYFDAEAREHLRQHGEGKGD